MLEIDKDELLANQDYFSAFIASIPSAFKTALVVVDGTNFLYAQKKNGVYLDNVAILKTIRARFTNVSARWFTLDMPGQWNFLNALRLGGYEITKLALTDPIQGDLALTIAINRFLKSKLPKRKLKDCLILVSNRDEHAALANEFRKKGSLVIVIFSSKAGLADRLKAVTDIFIDIDQIEHSSSLIKVQVSD